jgi:predicted transposase/invertase (TIGR01784 family)
VELQVRNEPDFGDRILYYAADQLRTQLSLGAAYGELEKLVVVGLLNFRWSPDPARVHTTFKMQEVETGQLLSTKLELHFLELKKIRAC